MPSPEIKIAGRPIGTNHPPYIIAELSGNHNGDLNRALRMMELAKAAGADAIKLQTYTADTITIDHDAPEFCIQGGLWNGRTLYELYQEAHTPWEWQATLFKKGKDLGIPVFSSPFDATAVSFLEELHTPAYKIASFELVDLPLIRKIAETGKPVILSTGLADLEEITEALETARSGNSTEVAILHCISSYPAPAEEANLKTVSDLASRFNIPVGLSDHTLGTLSATTAIACGASIIEKHFTDDRSIKGPDSAFSTEPSELAQLVRDCKTVWESLGNVNYDLKPSERANLVFRRSLYVVSNIKKGELFSQDNIRSIRPNSGLPPKHMDAIIGKRAGQNIPFGTPLSWSLIDE
jgi:pseudaminic acid synthase